MTLRDTLGVGEVGKFTIDAEYFYRFDLGNKIPEVEKIEIRIHTPTDMNVHVVRLLDIPYWLWQLLTDPSTLAMLSKTGSIPHEEKEELPNAGETDA